jgi:hypothetical protein
MPNHVHLILVRATTDGLARAIDETLIGPASETLHNTKRTLEPDRLQATM